MNLFAHHISHTHLLSALCQPEEKAHSPDSKRERERQIKRQREREGEGERVIERGREKRREGPTITQVPRFWLRCLFYEYKPTIKYMFTEC